MISDYVPESQLQKKKGTSKCVLPASDDADFRDGWSSTGPPRRQMLHRSLIGHIPDVCSMICAKLLAAALVIRARIISNTVLTWPFEYSLRSSVSPMDGGQSGGTFGTVIINNTIHCGYANCHITSKQLHSVSQASISILYWSSKSTYLEYDNILSLAHICATTPGVSEAHLQWWYCTAWHHQRSWTMHFDPSTIVQIVHTSCKCNHMFPLAHICPMTPGVSQAHLQWWYWTAWRHRHTWTMLHVAALSRRPRHGRSFSEGTRKPKGHGNDLF